MRVSLVSPLTIGLSPREASEIPYGDAPLGVLTLAAVARNQGHIVQFADLDYLSHHLPVDHFAVEAANWIADARADLYGFGTICDSYPLTLRVAREVARLCPAAKIILGGPQASVTDLEVLLALPEVDLVVRGEAEETFAALLQKMEAGHDWSKLPGLTLRGPFGPQRTAVAPLLSNLDIIPDPAWDLDPVFAQRPDASVEMGRGCPFACDFCSTNDFFRRKYRMKSPARVLGQMAEIARRYGFRKFSLVHDMFTVDRRRVLAFCTAAEQMGSPFEWGCSARTDCLDEALLERMYAAGCRKLFFGVETGSGKLQQSMGKGLDLDQARRLIASVDAYGMRSTVSLITGFPDETEADLRDTADMFLYASQFGGTDVQMHLLNALAGTPLTTRHRHALQLNLDEDAWSGDPQDREWIRDYPNLFVNFYTLPALVPRVLLRGFQALLRCGRLRFNWLLQSLHRESGHIYEVFLRFYEPCAQRNSIWYRSEHFTKAFLAFARELSAREGYGASLVLAAFYESWSESVISRSDLAHADQPLPVLPAQTALVRTTGDVLGIMEAIRENRSLTDASTGQPGWVVVRAGVESTGEIQQISELAGTVLQWCDGRATALEIGQRAKQLGFAPAALPDQAVADILLGRLEAEGLICYSS